MTTQSETSAAVQEHKTELTNSFEDASLHLEPGARHNPQDDRPDIVADLLRRG